MRQTTKFAERGQMQSCAAAGTTTTELATTTTTALYCCRSESSTNITGAAKVPSRPRRSTAGRHSID